tara:strand:- start:1560 stop:2726 length:1167 start_codon:yes stop_codon:yes gene_type:complete
MKVKNWPNFDKDLISKVCDVIESGKINYTTGPFGEKFETKFSKFIGNKYSVAVCNGTAALEVAIKSLNLPKNSKIIVPARSFFSSAACIVNTGHTPVFVDVDLKTQNISLKDLKNKITKNIRAIICVHLAGLPCDMHNIKKIINKYKIKIIEDCSQAHGASIDNKQVGTFGDVSTWSFCTDKIISTLGEGGMISTNKKKIYEFCKRYVNHGTVQKSKKNFNNFIYNKDYFGTNLRITEIQSLAGLEQLKNLNKIQIKREKMAKDYFDLFSIYKKYFDIYFPPKNIKSAWYRFYFFIKIDVTNYKKRRIQIIKKLGEKKIKCFTGSCPEIYLERSFKKLKNYKKIRLKNCKRLGTTSIALDVNHTLNYRIHNKNLLRIKNEIKKIFFHT